MACIVLMSVKVIIRLSTMVEVQGTINLVTEVVIAMVEVAIEMVEVVFAGTKEEVVLEW
jgi:hypothetical protein